MGDLISFNQAIFLLKYKTKKLPFSFDDMFPYVYETEQRRTRLDYFDFALPNLLKPQFCNFPKYKIIQNWNQINFDFKSLLQEKDFRLLYRSNLIKKYEQECTELNCFSCQHN